MRSVQYVLDGGRRQYVNFLHKWDWGAPPLLWVGLIGTLHYEWVGMQSPR